MTPDRRTDSASRDRFDEIEGRIDRFLTRAARNLRVMGWILAAILVVSLAGAVVYTLQQWRISDVVNQIQAERKRNTLAACHQANMQNAAIVGFVSASVPADRRTDPLVMAYLARAAKTFPQANCALQVKQRVKASHA